MVVKALNWATLGAVLWCVVASYQIATRAFPGQSLGYIWDRIDLAYFLQGSFFAGMIFAAAYLLYRFLMMLNRKFPD